MPIYAYRCQSCGFEKDVLQKISDPVLVECPECHQPSFAKQLTAAGFQLKGTGWYVTDFKNGQQKPPARTGAAADAAVKPGEAPAKSADAPVKPADAPAKPAEKVSSPAPATSTASKSADSAG